MLNFLLAVVSFVLAFLLVLLLVGIGWYIVWKLFLSRFRFVRELLVANNGASEVHGTPRTRVRRPRIDWAADWCTSVAWCNDEPPKPFFTGKELRSFRRMRYKMCHFGTWTRTKRSVYRMSFFLVCSCVLQLWNADISVITLCSWCTCSWFLCVRLGALDT